MAKFTLAVNPTFTHTITIPVAGAEDADLLMTFRHHKLDELAKAEQASREKQQAFRDAGDTVGELASMAEFILHIAEGWAVPEPFDKEHLLVAFVTYPRFFEAVLSGYTRELWCLRQKP